ncbi:hypothetical protein HHK36_003864 [Tetracentron sinense]|uniref:Uncharacterized protein n=1 Tax=Tetracentron sinense TaxID=13715 RepID=A0A835DSX0_TETSI|nr:hypothetical protein HHK36_003864 [Tetracentron sinense]
MASALLASRNESYWGEPKVYTRKNPNTNPNPNLKANPNKQIHDPASQIHGREIEEPAAAARTVSDDSSSLNRKSISLNNRKESSLGGYVTFKIDAYSRKELKELKKRLISELEQVRNLSNRIELREIQIQSRSGYSASQFSGSYGGREVTSSTRPPPPPLQLQVNYSLDSPGANGLKEKRTPKANQYYRPSEFVMGNDKMPSDNKKVSGNKRPHHLVSGRDAKRPAASEPRTGKLFSSMMKQCGQILRKLMKHKHSWIFNVPVDVVGQGLHDYNQIIKYPMDLGTVKSKLGKNLYASPLDFASDVRLTFNNALVYNPKGHDVYVMAEQLLARFIELFEPAYKKFTNEQQQRVCADEEMQRRSWTQISIPESRKKADSITPSSKRHDSMPFLNPPLIQTPPQTPASVQAPEAPDPDADLKPSRSIITKQPKPKAKDPNKREMSFDEKSKLGMSLQNLPAEKMEQVVQILRKRNGQLAQDGDEIELDFEAMDTETLWELDRYVYNCKKTMGKIKRQEHASHHISTAKSPIGESHEAAKKTHRGEIGEEDVDIGEEIPTNNFPPVEIEKDAGYASSGSGSSSFSSSSSGSSSSSDSDSGSSSGSDSDDARSPCNESKDPPRAQDDG